MAVRPIDANELYRIEKLLDTDIVRQDKVALNLLEQVLYDIQHVPTLTQPNEGGKDKNVPTNEPLTLEELSLCNDPVWIKRIGDEDLSGDGWVIVEGPRCLTWHNRIPVSWEILVWWPGSEVEDCPKYENYNKTWIAYRRPPEGEV